MLTEQEQSLNRLVGNLLTILWPDRDENGVPRWQVNELDITVTGSGGSPDLLRLQMTPGVNGLHVTVLEESGGHTYVADSWEHRWSGCVDMFCDISGPHDHK